MEKTVTTNEYKKEINAWKADYKDLSKSIREMKAARKQYVWAGKRPRRKIGDNPNYDSNAQWKVENLRDDARKMMAQRIELKLQAQEYAKNRDME